MRTKHRTQLFDAVATNNHRLVHRLVSSGLDIDARLNPSDEVFMTKLWLQRCHFKHIKSPFFLASDISEDLRPTALHFAIAFNSYESMEILLDAGANRNLKVWFSDVADLNGTSLAKKNDPDGEVRIKVFDASHLIDAAYERNIHRLTENMAARKILNWKAVCGLYHKRLRYLFAAPAASKRLSVEQLDTRGSYIVDLQLEGQDEEAAGAGAGTSKKKPQASEK